MFKEFPMEMNGLHTKVDFNIIPLGSYDFLIGMDSLDEHQVVIECYNKAFTWMYEEGNLRTIQVIPRAITIREVLALQLKKSYRKWCQVFAAHMEETPKDKVPNVEDWTVLKEFEDAFKEISGFPLKRNINFFINMMSGVSTISRTPYRMSMTEMEL